MDVINKHALSQRTCGMCDQRVQEDIVYLCVISAGTCVWRTTGVCVWLELSEVKWDSGLHGVKGVLWVSSRRLLTDSGVGRRALALTA